MVYEVTSPRSHRKIRTTAIISSIGWPFFFGSAESECRDYFLTLISLATELPPLTGGRIRSEKAFIWALPQQ